MEVTYELTPDDLWHYNRYYLRTKAPLRSLLISNPSLITKIGIGFLCLVLLFSFGLSVVGLFQHHSPDWVMLLCPFVLVPATLSLLPPSRKRLAKTASQQPGFLCEHTIRISPESFAEKTSVNDTKIAWTMIQSIEEDQSHFYLFLSKNIAFIVPKRAFTYFEEAQAFLDTSRRYWQAARNEVSTEDRTVWPPAPRPEA